LPQHALLGRGQLFTAADAQMEGMIMIIDSCPFIQHAFSSILGSQNGATAIC
jgi:hypothetical protein